MMSCNCRCLVIHGEREVVVVQGSREGEVVLNALGFLPNIRAKGADECERVHMEFIVSWVRGTQEHQSRVAPAMNRLSRSSTTPFIRSTAPLARGLYAETNR